MLVSRQELHASGSMNRIEDQTVELEILFLLLHGVNRKLSFRRIGSSWMDGRNEVEAVDGTYLYYT